MKNSEPRIPKEIVPEVFALAARLQEQKQQSYSLEELTQIGSEVKISPEFIQMAVQEIQAKQIHRKEQRQNLKEILLGMGVVFALLGFWNFKALQAQPLLNRMMHPCSSRD